MRVLLVHNRYQIRAGEDQVFDRERDLLRRHGHDVSEFVVSNDGINGPWPSLKVAWNTPYSRTSRLRLAEAIADFRPRIVHVHNFFPLLTPSVYDACADAGVPVVQRLPNFRLMCAGATFMRDNRVCEDCLNASPYHAVLHGCYRGSRLGSLAVARMIDVHRRRHTWHTKVDRFITPSVFAKERYVAGGFPADRISVKPNFLPDDPAPGRPDGAPRRGGIYVGRLSSEKGIATLLAAWRDLTVPLTVVGDGPLRGLVETAAERNPSISLRGHRPNDEVAAEMRRAAFLVMPSEWYETFGIVIIEAFCRGLPVIASRLGAVAELVDDGKTGHLVEPGNAADLAEKARWMRENPSEVETMGARARRRYETLYTPEVNIRQLMTVYNGVLRGR